MPPRIPGPIGSSDFQGAAGAAGPAGNPGGRPPIATLVAVMVERGYIEVHESVLGE